MGVLGQHSTALAVGHCKRQQLARALQLMRRRANRSSKRLEKYHQLRFAQNKPEAEWRYKQLRAVFRAVDAKGNGTAAGSMLKELGFASAVRDGQCGWSWTKHCKVLEAIAPWHVAVTEDVFITYFGIALPLYAPHFDALTQSFYEHVAALAPDPALLQPPAPPRTSRDLQTIRSPRSPKRRARQLADEADGAFHTTTRLPFSCRVLRPGNFFMSEFRRQLVELGGTLCVQSCKPPIWTLRIRVYKLWHKNTVGETKAKRAIRQKLQTAVHNRRQQLSWEVLSMLRQVVADARRARYCILKAANEHLRRVKHTSLAGLQLQNQIQATMEATECKAAKYYRKRDRIRLSAALQFWVCEQCRD